MELGWARVKEEKDVLKVRQSVKFLCEELGLNNIDTIKTLTATSELVRYIHEYASEGKIFYHLIVKGNKKGLQLIFKDQGKGMANLDLILNNSSSPMKSSAVGLLSAKRLSDEFNINTKIGKGTTIEIIKWLNTDKEISQKDINILIKRLSKISEDSIIEALRTQNKFFIELIDENNKKTRELEEIKQNAIEELAESNKEYMLALEELDKAQEELESIKRSAMEEIAQADEEYLITLDLLDKSQENLKSMIKELELYANIISHDLKEPLIVNVGFLKLIKRRIKDNSDFKLKKFIDITIESADHMKRLLDDLLKYSKMTPNKESFELSDIGQILHEIFSDLSLIIKKKGAIITHDPLPTLMVNPIQIRQLFQNLIQNAIKFKREDPVYIHISAEQKEKSWVFSVSDNGIGIEMENTKQIFLIFKRLHSEKEYPGTGLGLAVCKKIIDNHDGSIWVESELGKGSTFFIALPIKEIKQKHKKTSYPIIK